MAGLMRGLGSVVGAPISGLLDFRQTLIDQRNDLLNPLVNRRQEQLAQQAGDQVRMAIGTRGLPLPGTVEGQEGNTRLGEGGLLVDTDAVPQARGLLSNPIFAQDRDLLEFSSQLIGNRSTNALGSRLLDSVLQNRMQVESTQQIAKQDALSDAAKAAQEQANKNRQFANQLVDDGRRELGPWVDQVPQIQGLYNLLANGSATDAVASIYLFFQALEPGGIVRDNETNMYRGAGGFFEGLANDLNAMMGGGDKEETRRRVAQTINRLIAPRLQAAQQTRQELINQAEASNLGQAGLAQFYAGLPSLLQPVLPEFGGGGGGGGDVDPAAAAAAARGQGLVPGPAPGGGQPAADRTGQDFARDLGIRVGRSF